MCIRDSTTMDERSIKVKIAPGTQSGTKLRIPESGLPRRNMPNADLLIEIKVIIPKLSIEVLSRKYACSEVSILIEK